MDTEANDIEVVEVEEVLIAMEVDPAFFASGGLQERCRDLADKLVKLHIPDGPILVTMKCKAKRRALARRDGDKLITIHAGYTPDGTYMQEGDVWPGHCEDLPDGTWRRVIS